MPATITVTRQSRSDISDPYRRPAARAALAKEAISMLMAGCA